MDYEAIVIGSGAGGGTFAGELAARGKRVLLLERGTPIHRKESFQDERLMLEDRIASDDRVAAINGRSVRPIVGSLPGGSTALFGAAFVRPAPEDFTPGRFYGERIEPAIRNWPIDAEDLAPYFERVEDLYAVAGSHAIAMPHLQQRTHAYKSSLPALEDVNVRLAAGLEGQGLRPFPLPLAIDFDRCKRCPGCPGMLCPHAARASSVNRAITPRLEFGLEVWEGCEALQLEHDGRKVSAVRVRVRETGELRRVTARLVVSSGGALGSPALLMRSRVPDASDQLGRNHMCHLGALAAAGFARSQGAESSFVKQLGISDFYLGTADLPFKLGLVQQIPIPGPRTLAKRSGVPLPRVAADFLRARILLFAGTLEDLPHPDNRVTLRADGRICLDRRFRAYDLARARPWARHLARVLRRAGADFCVPHVARDSHDHLAHQVGTCRFGRDAKHSVLDPFCRVHALDNLYVIDGSFMPTSLGVGPALMIAANALRVADHLLGPGGPA